MGCASTKQIPIADPDDEDNYEYPPTPTKTDPSEITDTFGNTNNNTSKLESKTNNTSLIHSSSLSNNSSPGRTSQDRWSDVSKNVKKGTLKRPHSVNADRRPSVRSTTSLISSTNWLRNLVSKKKKRHVEGGFNLDLSYVTPRIIAMGFPCYNWEASHRNPLTEVRGFLDWKHGEHYMLFNLCSERTSMPEKFDGRWVTWPFDDHNPCPLPMLGLICESVKIWLDENPKNVAAIHCKAGKGRTGTIICALLLHLGLVSTAQESMSLYAQERTYNQQGVTIRSQRRYVQYYDQLLNNEKKSKEKDIVKEKAEQQKEQQEHKENEEKEEKAALQIEPDTKQDPKQDPKQDSQQDSKQDSKQDEKSNPESEQKRNDTVDSKKVSFDIIRPLEKDNVMNNRTEENAILVADPGIPIMYRLVGMRLLNAPKLIAPYFKIEVPVRNQEIELFGLQDKLIKKKLQEKKYKTGKSTAQLGITFARPASIAYKQRSRTLTQQSSSGRETNPEQTNPEQTDSEQTNSEPQTNQEQMNQKGKRSSSNSVSSGVSSGGVSSSDESESDEEEEENYSLEGQGGKKEKDASIKKKSASLLARSNPSDSVGSVNMTRSSPLKHVRSKSEGTGTELILPTRPKQHINAAQKQNEGETTNEDDDKDYHCDFNIDRIDGEEFRFGMVMVHDSRQHFLPNDGKTSPSNVTSSTKRISSKGTPCYDIDIDVHNNHHAADEADTLTLAGDTRIRIKNNSVEMFHFWFHTNFIENNKLILFKSELDCKSIKSDKKYADDFGIELMFEKCNSLDRRNTESSGLKSVSNFAYRRAASLQFNGDLIASINSENIGDSMSSKRENRSEKYVPVIEEEEEERVVGEEVPKVGEEKEEEKEEAGEKKINVEKEDVVEETKRKEIVQIPKDTKEKERQDAQNTDNLALSNQTKAVVDKTIVTNKSTRTATLHTCTICNQEKKKTEYSGAQWKKGRKKGTAKCKICASKYQ